MNGVGILVKEEFYERGMEVLKRNDRVTSMVLMFGEEMVKVICAYDTQSGRTI